MENTGMTLSRTCGNNYVRLRPEAQLLFDDLLRVCKGKNTQDILDAINCLASGVASLSILSLSPEVEKFFRV